MGTKLHDEVVGFEPEGEHKRLIGPERTFFRPPDRGEFSAGGDFVQVDEKSSVSSSWSDDVTISVILALPTLHSDPLLIG